MKKTDYLKSLVIFSFATQEDFEFLETISSWSTYPKGSTLYYEADTSTNLMFLVEGLMKVYKVDKYDNEIFLYYVYENNLISELSSLDSDNIYCFSNAEFEEDSLILSINYPKFKERYLSQNSILSAFIKELIIKNQQMQCIVNRELVFDATAKVAHMLYNNLDMFNKQKRSEVAFMLHIQPETLSRVLKRMVRNSLIEINRGQVTILNEESLKAVFTEIG